MICIRIASVCHKIVHFSVDFFTAENHRAWVTNQLVLSSCCQLSDAINILLLNFLIIASLFVIQGWKVEIRGTWKHLKPRTRDFIIFRRSRLGCPILVHLQVLLSDPSLLVFLALWLYEAAMVRTDWTYLYLLIASFCVQRNRSWCTGTKWGNRSIDWISLLLRVKCWSRLLFDALLSCTWTNENYLS